MAKCIVQSDSWMTNHIGQDPCNVAGQLYGPCNGAGITVEVLSSNASHYTPGSADSPPTPCSCSWAVYNLLQACAACQSTDGDQDITTWGTWVTDCSSGNTTVTLTDGTWWPSAYQIPSGTRVPAWAIKDPNTWTGGRFDPTAAESIANQNIADSQSATGPQPTSPGSGGGSGHKAPIGAIIGGVLGGLALITAIIFLIWYARYKTQKSKKILSIPLRNGHHRPSDSYSTKPTPTSGALVVGHDGFTSPFGMPATGGQLGMSLMGPNGQTTVHHAHNISGDSTTFPQPHSPPSHSRQISNESVPQSSMQHGRNLSTESSVGGREAMITPFLLPGGSPETAPASNEYPDTPAGRKAREAARERERAQAPSPSSATLSQSQSRRMNPPTYESSLVASPGSAHGHGSNRPPHNRTISNDSSPDVSSVAGSNVGFPTPTSLDNGTSIAGGGGLASPAVASSSAYPPGLSAGGRLTLHSVDEPSNQRQDQPDYFGPPSAWRGDRKEG